MGDAIEATAAAEQLAGGADDAPVTCSAVETGTGSATNASCEAPQAQFTTLSQGIEADGLSKLPDATVVASLSSPAAASGTVEHAASTSSPSVDSDWFVVSPTQNSDAAKQTDACQASHSHSSTAEKQEPPPCLPPPNFDQRSSCMSVSQTCSTDDAHASTRATTAAAPATPALHAPHVFESDAALGSSCPCTHTSTVATETSTLEVRRRHFGPGRGQLPCMDSRSQLQRAQHASSTAAATARPRHRTANVVLLCVRFLTQSAKALSRVLLFATGATLVCLLLAVMVHILVGGSREVAAVRRAARAAADGVLREAHLPPSAFERSAAVVAAAEMATGALDGALRQHQGSLPVHWLDAQQGAIHALASIAGSDLQHLVTAMHAADVERAGLLATVRGLEATLQHHLPTGNAKAVLASAHEGLAASASTWVAHLDKVQKAWVVVNGSYVTAEQHFTALATWVAAARQPSTTSLALIALQSLSSRAAVQARRVAAASAVAAAQSQAYVAAGVGRGVRWATGAGGQFGATLRKHLEAACDLRALHGPGLLASVARLGCGRDAREGDADGPATQAASSTWPQSSQASQRAARHLNKFMSSLQEALAPGMSKVKALKSLQQPSAATPGSAAVIPDSTSTFIAPSFGSKASVAAGASGLEQGGFRAAAQEARRLQEPWEMLMAAPQILRRALDSLNRDVASVDAVLQSVGKSGNLEQWLQGHLICYDGSGSRTADEPSKSGDNTFEDAPCTLEDLLLVLAAPVEMASRSGATVQSASNGRREAERIQWMDV